MIYHRMRRRQEKQNGKEDKQFVRKRRTNPRLDSFLYKKGEKYGDDGTKKHVPTFFLPLPSKEKTKESRFSHIVTDKVIKKEQKTYIHGKKETYVLCPCAFQLKLFGKKVKGRRIYIVKIYQCRRRCFSICCCFRRVANNCSSW